MKNIELVVGSKVITGSKLAEELISQGWIKYGLARNPNTNIPGLVPVKANLLNEQSLSDALHDIAPTTYFSRLGCGMIPRRKTFESTALW